MKSMSLSQISFEEWMAIFEVSVRSFGILLATVGVGIAAFFKHKSEQ
ncbi:hypothetical protein [Priestia flexa]|nr:hypothetical protein [Priestia flexa]